MPAARIASLFLPKRSTAGSESQSHYLLPSLRIVQPTTLDRVNRRAPNDAVFRAAVLQAVL
jgi:hypothetical protein